MEVSLPRLPRDLTKVSDERLRELADQVGAYIAQHPGKAKRTEEAVNDELYRRLTEDETEWDMPTIAVELDVERQTVKSWRRDSLEPIRQKLGDAAAQLTAEEAVKMGIPPHPNHLPLPFKIYFGKPVWKAGPTRKWAMQTGRMTAQGVPQKSKPPGRPRRSVAAA